MQLLLSMQVAWCTFSYLLDVARPLEKMYVHVYDYVRIYTRIANPFRVIEYIASYQ